MTYANRSWWHELSTWEPQAALDFYGKALGWEFEANPLPDGAGYWIAHKDGRPVGSIFELTLPHFDGIPSHWMTYLTVPDIRKAAFEAARAGGEVMRPATRVPGVGKLAVVADATGALIGLMEPEITH
jgi:hypothetical protein